jgi:hypothetical protein
MDKTKETWSLSTVRDVLQPTDQKHKLFLHEVLDSLQHNNELFNYHIFKSRDAREKAIGEQNQERLKDFVLMPDHKKKKDIFEANAHFLAATHTLRHFYENFAQLLNQLAIDRPLPIQQCTLRSVAKRIKDDSLKSELDALLTSPKYRYFEALVNVCKHRYVVSSIRSFQVPQNTFDITLKQFEYAQVVYPPCPMSEALEGLVEIKNMLVRCGNIFNQKLSQPIIALDQL